jgi:reverse gyrase
VFYCSYCNGDVIFAGKKTINRVEFSTCLNELKNEIHNGFTEQEVEILIDALVSIKDLGKLFSYCTFSETCFKKKNFFRSLVIFQPFVD